MRLGHEMTPDVTFFPFRSADLQPQPRLDAHWSPAHPHWCLHQLELPARPHLPRILAFFCRLHAGRGGHYCRPPWSCRLLYRHDWEMALGYAVLESKPFAVPGTYSPPHDAQVTTLLTTARPTTKVLTTSLVCPTLTRRASQARSWSLSSGPRCPCLRTATSSSSP